MHGITVAMRVHADELHDMHCMESDLSEVYELAFRLTSS